MSKIYRSSQVKINQKKYKLNNSFLYSGEEESTESPVEDPVLSIERQCKERLDEADKYREDIIKAANMDAREIIETARHDGEKIVADAYDKSREIFDKAKEDGYTEGVDKGFEEGKRISDEIIQDALNIKKQWQNLKEQLYRDSEEEMVNLVIATVEKMVDIKIQDDHEFILGLISKGLEKVSYTENLTIRVSGEDYGYAVSFKDRILALAENIDDVEIKQDNSLKSGSCIIDTDAGSVDSGIWQQFEEVREMFLQLLKVSD